MNDNKSAKICIVKGCGNSSAEGRFIGDLCVACHTILKTGIIKNTKSFLADKQKNRTHEINNIRTLLKNGIGMYTECFDSLDAMCDGPAGKKITVREMIDYLIEETDKKLKIL